MTDLQVVNRALTILGCQPAATMVDTAKAAARAITAYTLCRDETLRLLAWPKCTKRVLMKDWAKQATPWTASATYYVGGRCTNDTAKTYQCITAGVAAGAGGPTGTNADITDGTVHWKYIEASTAANNWCWAPLTVYAVDDLVSNNTGRIYACITTGTSAAATGPVGETADITDGTVHWRFYCRPGPNLTIHYYTFVIPPDCVRLLKVPDLAATSEVGQGVQFVSEGSLIYCGQAASPLKYVKRETDPTNWDALMQWTVALKIAAEIAFDVTGSTERAGAMANQFAQIYATARGIAMGEGSEGPPEDTPWQDV